MKKYLILVFLLIVTCMMQAQPEKIKDIFAKYEGKDGFTTVNLGDMSVLKSVKGVPDLAGIKSIKILTYEAKETVNKKLGEEFSKALKNIELGNVYKELMSVRESKNTVKMYVRKEGDTIKEFLMTVSSKDDDNVLIWMSGKIDLDKLDDIKNMFNDMKKQEGE